MNTITRLLTALALATAPTLAAEPTAHGDIHSFLRGTGGFSCGQYVEYEKQGNPAQMDLIVQWVWGYLYAYNGRGLFNNNIGHEVTQVATPDSPTVLLFISQHCRKYPLDIVASAVIDLIHSSGGPIVYRPNADKK